MLQCDERRGFKRAKWVPMLSCPTFHMGSITQTHIWHPHTHVHTFRPLIQIQTNWCRDRQRCIKTHTKNTQSWLPELQWVTALWMTGLTLRHRVHLHIFTFLTASARSSFLFHPPLMNFPMPKCVCMCVCVHTPPTECVCHSVLLQGREGEACLFQGTPPELMFHTCAQCGTLYRASQVHCINCGRNHFIGGVGGEAAVVQVVVWGSSSTSFSPSPGMHSITQYSHLNCF